MAAIERYYREVAEGKRRGVPELLLLVLLYPFSLLYGLILRLRAYGYATGMMRSFRLPVPVISVGNLTVGGTGKTPTVAMLARRLIDRGMRVVVLSRGYGGSSVATACVVSDGTRLLLSAEEAGDEPYLLASSIPGLIVVIGADRHQAGLFAIERFAPDVVLLDDGFQHLRLKRDLDILLLDCRHPFGNGLSLPAGLLREPRSAASRCDLVIHTRCSQNEAIHPIAGKPSCRASHRLIGAAPLDGCAVVPFSSLRGKRGVAFAGIADPEAFFSGLREEGLSIAATLPLSDHCRYGEGEVEAICRLREDAGADFLITTAKDGTKLVPRLERLGTVYVALLELVLLDPEPLDAALEKLLQK